MKQKQELNQHHIKTGFIMIDEKRPTIRTRLPGYTQTFQMVCGRYPYVSSTVRPSILCVQLESPLDEPRMQLFTG